MDKKDTAAPAGDGLDRRSFLKGAAAAGAAMASVAQVAAAAEDKKPAASAPEANLRGDKLIARPGSDFMVDVIKSLGIEYIASNPASSFRSLHESIVNYGGNKKPEFLTCMHEESSVAIAHGYAKTSASPWRCSPTPASACSTPPWRSTTPGSTACRY